MAILCPLASLTEHKLSEKANTGSFPKLPHATAFLRDTSSVLLFSTRQGKLNTPSDLLLNLTRNRKCHGRIMQLFHWTFPVPSSFFFFFFPLGTLIRLLCLRQSQTKQNLSPPRKNICFFSSVFSLTPSNWSLPKREDFFQSKREHSSLGIQLKL